MRFSSILLALTLALAGCASTPHVPNSQLTGLIELPTGTSQAIHLPATLRYTVPASSPAAGSKEHQYYLVAGNYRPYKYNQSGTFYLGEQPAIVERTPAATGSTSTLRIGGIWIPADPATAPKLFIVSDYYKQLPDGAPVPQQMSSHVDLSEFRHQAPAHTDRRSVVYIPAVIPGTLRSVSPLQVGLAVGAIAGVLALLNEPGASRELVFASADMADPDSVRQIRTAFPSASR